MKTRIILKAAKKKVTEVKKTMMAERKAKKKAKKTIFPTIHHSLITFVKQGTI